MSSGGRRRVVRPTQMEKCAAVVTNTAQEFAPAAKQALTFFGQGMKDWLAAAHNERVQAYQAQLQLEGARDLNLAFPHLTRQAEQLSGQITQACARLDLQVPEVLVTPPLFVTATYLQAQEQVLKTISAFSARPEASPAFADIVATVEDDQRKVSQAADQLAALNARHIALPAGTMKTPTDFLTSLEPEKRKSIYDLLERESHQLSAQVEHEVAQSWEGILLAQAALAAQEIGFAVTTDMAQGTLTAVDPGHAGGTIVVRANSQANEFQYDLRGYKGKTCHGPERQFLQALRRWAGDAFVDGIAHYDHETDETRRVDPRKTKPVKSGDKPTRDSTRPRQRN